MYRLERILCPTDFSEYSLETIRYAASMTAHYGGSITLLYVDTVDRTPVGRFLMTDAQRASHRSDVERLAATMREKIIGRLELDPEQTHLIVRFGTSYREIINEAESGNYSAVAIATQGLGYVSPYLIGRTAERVVRLCRAPVITVRPRGKIMPFSLRTILCPTDFSEYGNYAIPYAISIARHFKATIVLLHATDLSVSHPELLQGKFPDPLLYHQFAHEVKFERLVGRDVEPENTIERVVQEREIDFVVMGTHGARGLRRVQIGNTTEEVIRRVFAPVLSITHPIHRTVFPRRFEDEYRTGDIAAPAP